MEITEQFRATQRRFNEAAKKIQDHFDDKLKKIEAELTAHIEAIDQKYRPNNLSK